MSGVSGVSGVTGVAAGLCGLSLDGRVDVNLEVGSNFYDNDLGLVRSARPKESD